MKECPRCNQKLPDSSFYKDKSKNDSLSSYCKQCQSEYHRKFRKRRLENNKCYDCGKLISYYWDRKRFCPECYEKRLKMNEQYEKERVNKGLCRRCVRIRLITQDQRCITVSVWTREMSDYNPNVSCILTK